MHSRIDSGELTMLYHELCQLTARCLSQSYDELYESFDQLLFELASRTLSIAEQTHYIVAMQALRRERQALQQAWLAEWRQPTTLADQHRIELTLPIVHEISRSLQQRCRPLLIALEGRLRDAGIQGLGPWEPQKLCLQFLRVLALLKLDQKSQLLLLKQFGVVIEPLLPILYQQLERHLIEQPLLKHNTMHDVPEPESRLGITEQSPSSISGRAVSNRVLAFEPLLERLLTHQGHPLDLPSLLQQGETPCPSGISLLTHLHDLANHIEHARHLHRPVQHWMQQRLAPLSYSLLRLAQHSGQGDHPIITQLCPLLIHHSPAWELSDLHRHESALRQLALLLENHHHEPQALEAALQALLIQLQQEQRRLQLVERRTLDALIGRLEQQRAEQEIDAHLYQWLRDPWLPKTVHHFLQQEWRSRLVWAHLQQRYDPTIWSLFCKTTEQLCQLTPEGAPHKATQVRDLLLQCQQRLARSKWAVSLSDLAKTLRHYQQHKLQPSDFTWQSPAKPSTIDSCGTPHLPWRIGSWFLYSTYSTLPGTRCKLAAYRQELDQLIFVSPLGLRVHHCSPTQFSEDLANQQALAL